MSNREEILRDRLVHTRRSVEQNDLPAFSEWATYWQTVLEFENMHDIEGRVRQPLMRRLADTLIAAIILAEPITSDLLSLCAQLKDALWASPKELEALLAAYQYIDHLPDVVSSTDDWQPFF